MIIDGKKIARDIRNELSDLINSCKTKKPGLAFVLIGKNLASQTYVRMKQKACREVDILSKILTFDTSISELDIISTIKKLNQDPEIHGILVQLPLPPHISVSTIMSAIDPLKDVDGFHPINMGKLLTGQIDGFIPCTPLGIQVLLEKSHIPTQGKHIVILGRSNIVGKPLAALMVQKNISANATVTIVNSYTPDVPSISKEADILVSAMGAPHYVKKHMVKKGAVVIDVGISKLNNKIFGDVDFESVKDTVLKITPVPGGVGPMTIAMVLSNTYKSFLNSQ